MFRAAALTTVLINAAFTLGQDTDCLPPHEGGPHMHGGHECCPVSTKFGDKDMHSAIRQCMEENGMKKPENGSGPPAKPDDAVMDCINQCVWKSVGLVGDDGELKKAEVQALIAEHYTGDLAPVATAAMENCFDGAANKISASSTCKSGSRQFLHCFTRFVFLNCPEAIWTDSDQCSQLKQIYTKCEDKPALFMLGGPQNHHH